jgi:DNA invertase Pin-like site-specific DNA recombinase
MIIGYIRVSRGEQNYELQEDSLNRSGVEQVFKEKVGSTAKIRPQFDDMLTRLRSGDVVVVWRIDRLGRSMLELVKLMVEFRERGIEFRSITEGIDTSTQMGRLWFSLSAIFAENEHQIIKERTLAGLAAAKLRGRVGGRPEGLTPEAKIVASHAATLYHSGKSIASIRKTLKIGSNTTIYRYLRHEGIKFSTDLADGQES